MKGEKLLFFSIAGTIMPKGRKKKRGSSLPYRLLTFGEEAEGVGFSPGVKKLKVRSLSPTAKGKRLPLP